MTIFVGVEEEKDSEKKETILHPIRPDLRSQLEKEQEERTSGTRPILIVWYHTFSTLLATHIGTDEFQSGDEECKLDMSWHFKLSYECVLVYFSICGV